MIPLYTELEFNNKKSKDYLPFKCEYCGNIFYVTKAYVNRKNQRTKINFCSISCNIKHRQGEIINTVCANCGKKIKKVLSQIKKSKSGKSFCCHSCSAIYNNPNRKYGIRRSKLEIWIEKELTSIYPNIEFHFNKRDAINSELDIFIPSLKLAFELNGIFHYEPIHGEDRLKSIKSNDNRKFQACIERNIELCLIDVSKFKHFKLNKAERYLEIITKIINFRLNKIESPLYI